MPRVKYTYQDYPQMFHLLEERIYARRREKRLSQDAVAIRPGLTRNCIQQMECYEHLPQTNTLFELMKALEFSETESSEFWNEYRKAYLADKELQRKREEDLVPVS